MAVAMAMAMAVASLQTMLTETAPHFFRARINAW